MRSWGGIAALSAFVAAFASATVIAPAAEPVAATWQRTADGVVVAPKAGEARKVRLEVFTDSIVRVTASPTGSLDLPKSLMVGGVPDAVVKFDVSASSDSLTLKTSKLTAEVSLATGAVRFRDQSGKIVLSGVDGGKFAPVKVEGGDFYAIRQEFNRGTGEGFYGLGQHQNGQMNYNGEDVILAQHNMDAAVPLVVSTRNYGLLWDNYSITRFGYPAEYPPMSEQLTLTDLKGNKGGLTARYYDGNKAVAERIEGDPNYQFIPDQANWPAEMKDAKDKDRRVVWEGKIETAKTGLHKFRFYVSGYFKLTIDGKLVMDSWRQGWQGWYRNLDVPMQAGVPLRFRAEWIPQGGYLRFLHLDPLPDQERHELSLHSDVAHAIDYYFIGGASMDEVIAGYRRLTGRAALLPEWAYGYWQSRQRYETQAQLLDVLAKYRELHLPLDNIVQDWLYWPEDAWGSHDFDASRFPDPGAMVNRVHAAHAHVMISIWPKFYPPTANYQEFDKLGLIYPYGIKAGYLDWVGPGYPSSNYEAYSEEARDIYWRQIRDKLDALGFDAWWMDNDEPDIHSNEPIDDRIKMMGPTALGPGAEFFNTYPLVHVCGFADRWQAAHPDTRAFILTRSGFGGIQRCGAALWSGDVASRWSDMRDQISAGVNFSLSGIPNWSFDIGGYTMEDRYSIHPTPANKAEWTELYTRWFQFGAFVPIFRSHGELIHREIFEIAKKGSTVYDILAWCDRLRYRLMPYIYTVASDTYHRSGTMMRGLVMDFPNDRKVRDIDDEYMFGPSFLVAPVTAYKARTRSVYLPAGVRWYDFYTGKVFDGGRRIDAQAPLAHMPLFVREGSIVPIGPDVQYTRQKPGAPITLTVYAGKDCHFDLYEDDGTTTGYAKGEWSRIPIRYDETSGTLTIGARKGAFPGMVENRVFQVRWISGPAANAVNFGATPDRSVRYTGRTVEIHRSRRP